MAITRKSTQYDVEHGGVFNKCFNNKGIPYYQQNGNTNHCDKFVDDACFTYDDTTKTMDVTNACVHCDLVVDHDALICNDTEVCGNTCMDGNLTVTCAICGCSTLEIDNDASFHCNATIDENLTVCGSSLVCCNLTVVCNTCIEGTTCIDGATKINNTLEVNGTTTLNGDVYIKGTTYDTHTEDLYIGADHITLREGAEQGLSSQERPGVLVEHYNANGDTLGIVVDNTGTARVGDIEIVHVFTTDDTNYYSDKELTTPTTVPAGKQLFQIGNTDPTTGLKEYYYVASDDTEPIATRDSNMCDHQLTCWDATSCDIKTVGTLPVSNAAILQYDVANCCYFHLENPGADGRIPTYDCAGNCLKWSECSPTGNDQLLRWNDTCKRLEYLPLGCNGEFLTTVETASGYTVTLPAGTYETVVVSSDVVLTDVGEEFVEGMIIPPFTTFRAKVVNGVTTAYIDTHPRPGVTSSQNVSSRVTTSASGSGVKSLQWTCAPSGYTFNTMADYLAVCANIPVNSRVVILCEHNHVTSEEMV